MLKTTLRALAVRVLVVPVLLAIPGIAAAQPQARNAITLTGQCTHLLLLGTDATSYCVGRAVNDVTNTGRTSFTFVAQKAGEVPTILTFSGLGQTQIKPNADTAVQAVDRVVLSVTGRPETEKAVGSCRFNNPNKSGATIRCSAETAYGAFDVRFDIGAQ